MLENKEEKDIKHHYLSHFLCSLISESISSSGGKLGSSESIEYYCFSLEKEKY